MAGAFLPSWTARWGTTPPVGWMLRAFDDGHWVRFHALPGSKRYAESAEETRIILERADSLGRHLFEGRAVWLAQSGNIELGWQDGAFEARTRYGLTNVADLTWDGEPWPVHAGALKWSLRDLSPLLQQVADDAAGPVSFVDQNTGSVLAPYDGGFDLFLSSAIEVECLRAEFSDWLSSHPAGL